MNRKSKKPERLALRNVVTKYDKVENVNTTNSSLTLCLRFSFLV
jgi:hypothetical protein